MAVDLWDADAFNQAFSEATHPYFEPERMSDFSLLTKRRAVTMAQAVLFMLHALDTSDESAIAHAYGDYIRMVAFAVIEKRLEARHPDTLLTWAQSLEMLTAGMYGEHGENAPQFHFGWVVGLDDLTEWLDSLGFNLDVSGLLADLEGNTPAAVKSEVNARRWTNEFIEEVRLFRVTHTAKETAEHFGVSDSLIKRKLKGSNRRDGDPWGGLK